MAGVLLLGRIGSLPADRPRGANDDAGAGWEARRLIAQMLWLKSHAVLHAGVEEREARPGEELARASEAHRHGAEGGRSSGHAGHGHEGAFVLVIPPRGEDFRGILGDIEREVKPYLGSTGAPFSKDTDQTLAFYRLITRLDPHHVQGYVIGATFLCRAAQYPRLGRRFLEEGERNNPGSFEIQTELGHFDLVYFRDYAGAEQHLLRSLESLPPRRKLSEIEEDARDDAYRWLALTYREWRRPADAVRIARAGLRFLPLDATLNGIVKLSGRRP